MKDENFNSRKNIDKMMEKQAVLGAAMVQKAASRFLSLKDKDIKPADAIRMAEVGVKIERMSRSGGVEHTRLIDVDTSSLI